MPNFDRMLRPSKAGDLSEPVAGGSFNLLRNPFTLLGLPLTAKPAAIKEAYEDAIEDEVDDADALMRAQQTLLTPRLRIGAEVGSFLDVEQGLVARILCDIRSGMCLGEMKERLIKLHSLPRSNVIAHYGSARPLDVDQLSNLIEAQATVAPGAVCDAINDARQDIALGRVDRESVSAALSDLFDRQTKAVIETLSLEDSAVALFDQFVSKIVSGSDKTAIFRLDVYISTFRQTVASELSKRSEAVYSACEAIRKNPNSGGAYCELDKTLRSWLSLVRPVQTFETHRQREDTSTRELYEKVRQLVLDLSNEQCEFDSAAKVVSIASVVFGHLPRAAEQMRDDASRLAELSNDKRADELLTPLQQACEQANNSHRTIESELLKAGFGSGSVGSIRAIVGQFVAAVDATSELTFSDAPWHLVRSIALSLNNESSSPQAAAKIIEGLLDYATIRPPTPDMLATLRQDQRALCKTQVESDLTKNLKTQNWTEVEQLAERFLTLETDETNLKTIRAIRNTAIAKRKANTRLRWFWGIVIVGGGVWMLANNGGTVSQTTPYRPPLILPNASTSPQTNSKSQTATSPNQIRDAFDEGEIMPAVGAGLAFTRANIRYCSFQRIRLEAARPAVQSAAQGERFSTVVKDYNSRCSNYLYRGSDKDAVDAELFDKRESLENEGRALASSWGSPTGRGMRR